MTFARTTDPIVAVATASGRGAVGIVRVSGARLAPLIEALCGRTLKPREATYLAFRDAAGEPVDHGLAIHFPSPHSFTGEDVLELQAHGGTVVLQLLLARCLEAAAETDPVTGRPRLAGLRVAEPGEFSQRAFLNGKIDLAQAEAIADLIDASTEAAGDRIGLGGGFEAARQQQLQHDRSAMGLQFEHVFARERMGRGKVDGQAVVDRLAGRIAKGKVGGFARLERPAAERVDQRREPGARHPHDADRPAPRGGGDGDDGIGGAGEHGADSFSKKGR